MKKILFLSLIGSALGVSSMASTRECGYLAVIPTGGDVMFQLQQGPDAGIDLTASGDVAAQLIRLNGEAVCVDVDSTTDQSGYPIYQVIDVQAQARN